MTKPMEEQEVLKKIEDFVGGELNQEEEFQLMSILNNNPKYMDLLNDEKDLAEGIKQWSKKELKERLQSIEATLNPIQLESRRSYKTPLLAAASVSILIALYFVFNTITPNSQDLFNTYYEPYQPYAPVTMRGEVSDLDSFDKAQFLYESGEFEKALPLYLNSEPSDERDFFIAQTQLALNNVDDAIGILENLHKTGAHPKTTITWFLALSYVKTENFDASKTLLQELSTTDNAYQEKAKELLKSL